MVVESLVSMQDLLLLKNLLSDGVSDGKKELIGETEICNYHCCKVFRRVIWIIDIPVKLIIKDNIVYSEVDMDSPNRYSFDRSVSLIELLPHRRDDLVLFLLWNFVSLDQVLNEMFVGHLHLVLLNLKQLLVHLVHLKV